ncbi:MAG: DinB family protein [Candidatus Hydrogenedentes bacterium]|nr:DinB family protein [Candidatus Hydrogenedentota bacterium]
MPIHDGDQLAKFSLAVRESSLKRLRSVPEGFENWRPSLNAMSFADLAHELASADQWLIRNVGRSVLTKTEGRCGQAGTVTRTEYVGLLDELEALGKQRAQLLAGLTDQALERRLFDERFGETTVWWIIVRGNLDHEAHHRGQVATYLRIISDTPNSTT